MKLAVDIDDTIAATNLHWAQICYERHGYPYSVSVEEILSKYKYVRSVPAWKNVDMFSEFNKNPREWFTIPPIEESIRIIQKYTDCFGCYITTRLSYCRDVTVEWLEANGFPLLPLYMADSDNDVLKWKANTLINSLGSFTGIIDDNRDLMNMLHNMNYPGKMICIGRHCSETSGRNSIFVEKWADLVPLFRGTV